MWSTSERSSLKRSESCSRRRVEWLDVLSHEYVPMKPSSSTRSRGTVPSYCFFALIVLTHYDTGRSDARSSSIIPLIYMRLLSTTMIMSALSMKYVWFKTLMRVFPHRYFASPRR